MDKKYQDDTYDGVVLYIPYQSIKNKENEFYKLLNQLVNYMENFLIIVLIMNEIKLKSNILRKNINT